MSLKNRIQLNIYTDAVAHFPYIQQSEGHSDKYGLPKSASDDKDFSRDFVEKKIVDQLRKIYIYIYIKLSGVSVDFADAQKLAPFCIPCRVVLSFKYEPFSKIENDLYSCNP